MITHLTGQFRLAWRNAIRNVRRTLLTAITVIVGTAMTVFTLSFLVGVYDGMMVDYATLSGHGRVVTTEYAKRELLRPLYANIPEVQPVLETIRAVPGVVDAQPVIRMGVTTATGEEIGEEFALVVGSTEAWYQTHLLPNTELLRGEWLQSSGERQVVLGRRVANQNQASVGGRITLWGQTQDGSNSAITATIVGIIGGNSLVDNQAFVSLETAQWMLDLDQGAVEVMYYTSDYRAATTGPVNDAIAAAIGSEYAVAPWYSRDLWPQTLPIISGMKYFISALVVFVMALAIFNTMSMSVLERTGEIGVMRAMGQSRSGAIGLFLLESLFIGAIGGLIGVGIGALGALALQTWGIHIGQDLVDEASAGGLPLTTTFYGTLTVDMLATAFVTGLLTAALGAAMPALRAASIQPSSAMRTRR